MLRINAWLRWLFHQRGSRVESAPVSNTKASAIPSDCQVVIALDFDGVLHPGTRGTFSNAPLLASFLQASPGVYVVISSSWRLQESLKSLIEWLPEHISQRVIGATPVRPAKPGSRQSEIEDWCAPHALPWVALDDEPRLFNDDCPWLVLVSSKEGLTPLVIEHLRQTLNHRVSSLELAA